MVPAVGHVAGLAEEVGAVGKSEVDAVVVVDLPVVVADAHLAAALPLCAHGVLALHPASHVELVDLLLDDVVAG